MTVIPRHHFLVPALEAISSTQGLDRSSIVVLDLFCGEGERLPMLLDSGFQVAALAASEDAASLCLDRIHAVGNRRVDLRHGVATTLPWPTQCFDIIVANSLSELLSLNCSSSIFSEIIRVLRPGGYLLGYDGADKELNAQHPTDWILHLWETGLPKPIQRLWARPQCGSVAPSVLGQYKTGLSSDLFSVRIRKHYFTECYSVGFHELASIDLKFSSSFQHQDLRRQIGEILPLLGYQFFSDACPELLLIPRHKYEERQLPLCLAARDLRSIPLIQYDISGGVVALFVFGPLQSDRRSPYCHFQLDCNSLLSLIDENVVAEGVHAVHLDIAVGVHCMERLLRSSDLLNHRSRCLPEIAAARFDSLIVQALRRCDLLNVLFSALKPFILYAGHDCYDEAIDVNLSLAHRAEVLVQPKGKPFHFYRSEDPSACWETDKKVFRSHLSQRFAIEVRDRWQSLNPQFVADSYDLMERRMGSLSALPYMANVVHRDRDSNTFIGWQNFLDLLGLPVHDPALCSASPQVNWIFCFHSFADESFRWGMDQLWSLYDMFLEAARSIQFCFPGDRIVLRPHPNSLRYFVDPSVIDRIAAGQVQGPTDLLDTYLQFRLCQEIAGLGLHCELSQLHPVADLLHPQNSIIVTRHGSIAIEAAWLERPAVFSCIAPYAFLFDRDCQFADSEGLQLAMQIIRDRHLSGKLSFPAHDEIARYQALLDTPLGVRRAYIMGEVPYPSLARNPMQDFDDFRYGPETPHDAAQRLLSCLNSPEERAVLVKVLGGSPNLLGAQRSPTG